MRGIQIDVNNQLSKRNGTSEVANKPLDLLYKRGVQIVLIGTLLDGFTSPGDADLRSLCMFQEPAYMMKFVPGQKGWVDAINCASV